MSRISREEFESILEEAYIEGYNSAYLDIMNERATRLCDVPEDPRFKNIEPKGKTREERRKSIVAQRKAIIAAERDAEYKEKNKNGIFSKAKSAVKNIMSNISNRQRQPRPRLELEY